MILSVLLLIVCGKEDNSPEVEPWESLLGRWEAEVYSDSGADKIRETTAITFYSSGSYRWVYLYAVNGLKDEAKSTEEEGTYVATETELTFTPEGGQARTLTYEITNRSDVFMIMTDAQGNVWNFTDYYKSRYQTY